MACHRRATFCFATLLSIVIMLCLFLEIIPPGMIRDTEGCHGMVFYCEKCPKQMGVGDYSGCARTQTLFLGGTNPMFVGALTLASLACGFITAVTLTAVVFGVIIFCDRFDWKTFLPPFASIYMVAIVLSLICNISAMSFWSTALPPDFSYFFSFYLGWIANGLLLILLILLLCLQRCGDKGEYKMRKKLRGTVTNETRAKYALSF